MPSSGNAISCGQHVVTQLPGTIVKTGFIADLKSTGGNTVGVQVDLRQQSARRSVAVDCTRLRHNPLCWSSLLRHLTVQNDHCQVELVGLLG